MQQTIPLPPNQPFDPELVRSMSLAYGRALGLSTKPDSATEVVALKIMEIVEQRRATTPTAIYLLAIEELRDGK